MRSYRCPAGEELPNSETLGGSLNDTCLSVLSDLEFDLDLSFQILSMLSFIFSNFSALFL